MTSVAVLEDDEAIRNYLAALIAGSGAFNLAGAFSSAEEAEIFFTNGLGNDVEIMLSDIQLPGKSGIDFIAGLKPLVPHIQFMVLSAFDDSERVFGALKAGASGYILKNTPAQQLIDALHDLRRGGSPMSSQIARKVVTAFQSSAAFESPKDELSLREKEVLQSLSKGYSYKEIAASLFISVELFVRIFVIFTKSCMYTIVVLRYERLVFADTTFITFFVFVPGLILAA